MAKNGFLLLQCLSFVLFLELSVLWGATDEDRKVYVVYMGSLPGGEYFPSSHHQNMLQEVVEGSSVEDILVRSYGRSFNGFAAKLTYGEREKLATMKGVVSVFPSRTLQLHTTRSWDFIGFNESIRRKRRVESDIIIGVIDTGIWPESESFSDEGFGPAPKKWKGACNGGKNFTCNNKIIGARYYTTGGHSGSARDKEGHGSHTASTVAGNHVHDASFLGLGQGTARGGVPSARIVAYKVCSPSGCTDIALLAAFDDAIADGVDLITVSLGTQIARDLREDTIAIGAFHAMRKGILTLNSAGNSGPTLGFTSSVAPWMMSVAASTTDRLFVDKVILGNGKTVVGYSLNTFSLKGRKFPLIYGAADNDNCTGAETRECLYGCVNSSAVKGKIVLCDQPGFPVARRAGAVGSIYLDDHFEKVSFVVSLPASALSQDNYNSIISYVNSAKNPQAEILKTSVTKDFDAPVVPAFSSRGPNAIIPDILKPDISAPGVDILAAYSPVASISDSDSGDKRHVKYNILSGTSMACPHVAGVAAYVKSFHPDWSPSAIKSAIMTTAWPMNSSKNREAELAYGSGHINPVEAINPGLVYKTFKKDYIKMLCSLGYNESAVRSISGDNSSCPEGSEKASPRDLNYPSISAQVSPAKPFTIKFSRTVTNVGLAKSTYRVQVLKNPRISIKVEPGILSFKSLDENKSFNVTVTGKGLPAAAIVSAWLVWSDGKHSVRSPIVVLSKADSI